MPTPDTIKALLALRKSLDSPMAKAQLDQLLKSSATFQQSSSAITGITAYELEAPALSLYPLNTPLRNMVPRVGGGTGIQANWRVINGINTGGTLPGIQPGQRGGVNSVSTGNYFAAYATLGQEVSTDFEAQYAAKGFDDPRALATLSGLRSLMLSEELCILGGNTSVPLNGGVATPTPSATDASTAAGTLTNNVQYSIICVALTLFGYRYGTVAGGIRGSVTRTNADGSTTTMGGGAGKVSANLLHTNGNSPATATYTITAAVAPVAGACAYAWFISATAGQERLVAITGNAVAVINALPTGTNQLASSLGANDNSTDAYVFDGFITQAVKAGSGAYQATLSATMTADNAGGVVEIDAALKDRWDNYQLGFTDMWYGSQVSQDLGKKILAGGTSASQRFIWAADPSKVAGGIMVTGYRNKFSMTDAEDIKCHLHPNMPPGMIVFTSSTIPYPLTGLGNVFQMRTRYEYNQIDWPVVTRNWGSGVYVDEVLQHYAPFSMGILADIRPG
jgi:hypothetical protein